jgi:hypothetical protein
MADLTRIGSSNVTPSSTGRARSSAPQGYSFAEEVSRRANVMGDQESPRNQASLKRLDRVLNSGQPLRGDVPRGFYLDLLI